MSTQDPPEGSGMLIQLKASWDEALFAEFPRRTSCSRLRSAWPVRKLVIRVYRNHAFEHVAAAAACWGAYAGLDFEWEAGGYDDSLTFAAQTTPPAVELVWYDAWAVCARLGDDGFVTWFISRLRELRRLSSVPILVCLIGVGAYCLSRIMEEALVITGLRIADLSSLVPADRIYDERVAKLSGSRLSELANMAVARRLGSSWLPSLAAPRLKAVVVDLDHTLYRGVLGEDGLQVELTPGHRRLQEVLASLCGSGVLLGMVSRNEERDVRALFASRADFPLRWDDFASRRIGWGAKSAALLGVCEDLRIAPDAVLYIDDNLGELLEVAAALPTLYLLHAKPDAALTARALEYFPRLWSWGVSEADLVRQADLQANSERMRLGSIPQSDPNAYYRELAPAVTLRISMPETAKRLHELSQKTNQFNLALCRLSEVDVARYLTEPDRFAVAISLRDRLSDSGMIAAMFGRCEGHVVRIDEWVISCRALGRGLEDYMATQALQAIGRGRAVRRFTFAYATGSRNQPGLSWLAAFSGKPLKAETGFAQISVQDLPATELPVSLTVEYHDHH